MKYLILLLTLFLTLKASASCVIFDQVYEEYISRRMLAFNDWLEIENSFQSCTEKNTALEKFQQLKENRIKTLRNYEKLGIKEEGGVSLQDHFKNLGESSIVQPSNKTNDTITNTHISPSSCKEVTLSNESVNFSNTRNQDGVGWCYAYAASDLLSYKYNERLSSISFSSRTRFSLKDQFKDASKQGGDVREAIEEAHKRLQGFCLESSLKSTDINFCHFQNIKELLSFLSVEANGQFSSCTESDLLSIFPYINLNSVKSGSSVSEKIYLEKLIDEHCKKNKLQRPLPKIKTFIAPYAKEVQIKNVIDREINKGNPVIWAFDVNKITKEEGSGDHAGIVMGRKYNHKTNKCEYLIRNSWGKSCPFDKDGEPTRCHEENGRLTGYFYVTEEHLLKNAIGAYYAE